VAGQIHDSSPVDFVSDVGAKVVRSQFVRKSQKPSIIISWGTKAGAKILDALFLSQFELQRADYWLTMLQSAEEGSGYGAHSDSLLHKRRAGSY
jgi:hypothetical protein